MFELPPSRRMITIGLVITLAALAFATLLWRREAIGTAVASTAPAAAASVPAGSFRPTAAQLASLTIEPAKVANFDAVVTVDGAVATDDNLTASVYSQYSGRITAIHAQAGQRVRKGAPLVTLLATEAAQAGSDIAAATAAEATALQQFELAKQTEQRQHELLLAEAGAEKDWRQSQTDLIAAENALRTARAALAANQQKQTVLGGGPAERSNGSEGVKSAAVIVAPLGGVIIQRQVAPGQYVNSLANGGSTPLFTITDLRTVWVVGNVSEDAASRIKIGQPVEISALALGSRTVRATVSWVSATVDPVTHRVPIRAEVGNADELLKPQMSAVIQVLEPHPTTALSVARSALVFDGALAHCYVVGADNILTPRNLTLGRMQGGLAEVKDGLKEGERVVTRGSLFIDAAAQGDNP